MPMNAREIALTALTALRKNNAWSDAALNAVIKRERPEKRDAALATRICCGTIQNMYVLDYYISYFLTGSIDRLQPQVRDILRMSLYQMYYLDRIPVSAVTNEAVQLTKKYANSRAASLVNALLRKAAKTEIPEILSDDPIELLSIKYSHPYKLVSRFISILGYEECESLLKANNEQVPLYAHLNTVKAECQQLVDSLINDSITFKHVAKLPGTFELSSFGSVESSNAFKEGMFYLQDIAAGCAVCAADIKPGMRVIDGCAAPGGKSFAAAVAMNNKGSILSCDLHKNKLARIEAGANRLGIDIISTTAVDSSVNIQAYVKSADVVMADVPCSGLGVIRKKPEIRYKDMSDFEGLPDIQLRLINNLSTYVKPGGILLYSTCTILPEENECVIARFLDEHAEFKTESFFIPIVDNEISEGYITLYPHIHGTDGFFIAKLRRQF